MAKYSPTDPSNKTLVFPLNPAVSEVKERVRRAHHARVASLVGFTAVPRLTAEMKKDIKLGRPVINQY